MMEQVQDELTTCIKNLCENVEEFWAGDLENSKFHNSGYVDLHVRQIDYKNPNVDLPIENYLALFEYGNNKTIMITGEEGCGKSTYVRKLALDWAEGHSYLRNKFDLVLLSNQYTTNSTVENELLNFVSVRFQTFLLEQMQNSSKFLLILDNLNEVSEIEPIMTQLMQILKHETYPNITIVVTTRRNHLMDLCNEHVSVNGFSDSSLEEYLKLQKCHQNGNSYHWDLLHLPLFSAIYCALQKGSCSINSAMNAFDLIKLFVDYKIKIHLTKIGHDSTPETIHLTLMLLGKYSLLNFTRNFCDGAQKLEDLRIALSENSFDMQSLTESENLLSSFFGKKKCPHQLIAEYLASCYIVNTFDVDIKLLVHYFIYFYTSFTEFILQNILRLWEDDKLSNKIMNDFLDKEEICFHWFCKKPELFEKYREKLENVEKLCLVHVTRHRNLNWINNLSKCPKLERLVFVGCKFSAVGAETLAKAFTSDELLNVTELYLNSSEMGSCDVIFGAVGVWDNLKTLDINCCNLTTKSAKVLIDGMNSGKLSKLQHLVVIKEAEIGKEISFCSSLAKCPKLTWICLRDCDLSKESLNLFIEAVQIDSFPNLEFLDLSQNKQIGQVCKLFTALGKLDKLADLVLSDCNITPDSLWAMSNQLNQGKLPKLENLDISCNECVGKAVDFLNSLANCKNIKGLIISKCHLTPESEPIVTLMRIRACEVINNDDD